ncbi:OLC1v1000043C1 [Oldenlandia corymbosa var. corymbosa]|uniref:OLC1v1000043C1 n=1 Tax=Oldenlandia corymbosa var. corymbosa TaxID=529605 RepID=A0AAV1D4G0_OLDCO|nr:OLC1v1000043C1 [Oldenlandia corymbosa var. corymbosa]
MGFPVCYSEVFLPKIFIYALSFLGFVRNVILSVFSLLGLSDFIEPADGYFQSESDPTRLQPVNPPLSAVLIRELLPVIKFSELVDCSGGGPPEESCPVCLYEFEGEEEIRWLNNCKHIFHRSCLDRWMDHDQRTCPLCRTPFVPRHLEEEFNQRLSAAAAASTSYFSPAIAHNLFDEDYDDNIPSIISNF